MMRGWDRRPYGGREPITWRQALAFAILFPLACVVLLPVAVVANLTLAVLALGFWLTNYWPDWWRRCIS